MKKKDKISEEPFYQAIRLLFVPDQMDCNIR